jgi:DNA-directed RNA polymerase specialized sigma24 family protein
VAEAQLTESRGSVNLGRAIELYAQGWTTRQIGAELGRDHSRIARWLRRAAIQMRPPAPKRMNVDTDLILWLRDQEGMTFRQIAEQVGMSVPGVTSRYRSAKKAD